MLYIRNNYTYEHLYLFLSIIQKRNLILDNHHNRFMLVELFQSLQTKAVCSSE